MSSCVLFLTNVDNLVVKMYPNIQTLKIHPLQKCSHGYRVGF